LGDASATAALAAAKIPYTAGFPHPVFRLQVHFRLGFLDGIPGLIYCGFQSVQFLHIKAKVYELRVHEKGPQRG